MPARRFERIALKLMLSGCAVMFGACVLIRHAQAQPGYVPPPTPLPPPVLNPSNPGTVPQPPYTPITPSTPGRSHCQQAARLALPLGAVGALGEGQEPESAGGEARGRRTLGPLTQTVVIRSASCHVPSLWWDACLRAAIHAPPPELMASKTGPSLWFRSICVI